MTYLERLRWWVASLAVAGCLLLTGCSVHEFRCETTLHANGSVERAIYQQQSDTPAEAQKPDVWQQTTLAPEILADAWFGSIKDLPIRSEPPTENGRGKVPVYFAAWGKFASVELLPQHFVRKVDVGDKRTVMLTQDYKRVDFGFVVEHRWSERLNDIVTLDDMRQARGELYDLLTTFALDVLSRGLGDDYDAMPLREWLRGEEAAWFDEALDLWYDWAASRATHRHASAVLNTAAQQRLIALCARHGLKLPGPANELFRNDEASQATRLFAVSKLRELIQRRDGKPLDENALRAIVNWLGIDEPAAAGQPVAKSPLEEVARQLKEDKYGGAEAFDKQTSGLGKRITGEFGGLKVPENFTYSMTMPGQIVETSGELVSPQQTVWTFEAGEAYPFGYEMRCRSLEAQSELQRKVFGGTPLDSLAAKREFVRWLVSDNNLADAIHRAAKQGSLTPIREHAASNLDGPSRSRLRRVQKLLQLDSN